eukprot:1192631-Prorocentrum_minimum.AAC.1
MTAARGGRGREYSAPRTNRVPPCGIFPPGAPPRTRPAGGSSPPPGVLAGNILATPEYSR